MCQRRLISYNQCTTLVRDVAGGEAGGEGKGWGVAEGTWERSVPSSQFCYERKTALKKTVSKNKKIVSALRSLLLRQGGGLITAERNRCFDSAT